MHIWHAIQGEGSGIWPKPCISGCGRNKPSVVSGWWMGCRKTVKECRWVGWVPLYMLPLMLMG